jgi:hypothetical protein
MSSRALVWLIPFAFLLTSLTALPSVATAAEEQPAAAAPATVSASYKKTLSTLLDITGARIAGEQVAYAVAQETLGAIAATGTEITEEIQKIVVDEALAEIVPKFSDIEYLTSLYAPFYVGHLDEADLAGLVEFYQSPLGQKTLAVLPVVGQNSAIALQQASLEQMPAFQQKVDGKLRAAGVTVSP